MKRIHITVLIKMAQSVWLQDGQSMKFDTVFADRDIFKDSAGYSLKSGRTFATKEISEYEAEVMECLGII